MVTSDVTVNVQTPEPEHPPPPLQPRKCEPASGVASSVTTVPRSYVSLQSPPQSMPSGSDPTVPDPPPVFTTVTTNVGVASVGASIGASSGASTCASISTCASTAASSSVASPPPPHAAIRTHQH